MVACSLRDAGAHRATAQLFLDTTAISLRISSLLFSNVKHSCFDLLSAVLFSYSGDIVESFVDHEAEQKTVADR